MRNLLGAIFMACVIGTAAGAVQAQPVESVGDHVTCFIQAIGPSKGRSASNAPIKFGYTVHCTPRAPGKRHIEVYLWRHDLDRNKHYQQAVVTDKDPARADKSEVFFSECSTAGITYGFHTQAILWGEHGNAMDNEDNSDEVLLTC